MLCRFLSHLLADNKRLMSPCRERSLVAALRYIEGMHRQRGVPVPQDTMLSVLRAFASQQEQHDEGATILQQLHCLMISSGLDLGSVLADHLICSCASYGHLLAANIVFCKIAAPTVYTWHAIIMAHMALGDYLGALCLYDLMQQDGGICPNQFIFSSMLKACGSLGSLPLGALLHSCIVERGLQVDTFVGSALIDMYTKCGCLMDAHCVLDTFETKDVVLWNTMITGYVNCGHGLLALEIFENMHQQKVKPNKVSFACAMKACVETESLAEGMLIHALIINAGFESDNHIGSTIVDMYVKCGKLEEAILVFDKLENQTIVSWNALLVGCATHRSGFFAFEVFERMQKEGVSPDDITYSGVIKACGSAGAVRNGMVIHDHVVRGGLESNVVLMSSLVDMYSKCGRLYDAHSLFDKSSNQNIVAFSTLIQGYADSGQVLLVLELYERMRLSGMEPDKPLLLCALKACANAKALEKGKLIHSQIKQSSYELDTAIGATLIEMYANCGDLEAALAVLKELPSRDVVIFSTLIAGYIEHGLGVLALAAFAKMQCDDIKPDNIAVSYALKACGCIGAIGHGNLVVGQLIESGLGVCTIVGTALVEMYAQCGSLVDSCKVFSRFKERNLAMWNAMIGAYAWHGHSNLARKCLYDMREEGCKPDNRTFTSVLMGFCHVGDVEQGLQFFELMSMDYGILPNVEHFNCVIDLLGRAGCLSEAESLMEKLPMLPDGAGLRSLLTSSSKFGTLEQGVRCFEKAAQSTFNGSAEYVIMSNLYADAQMWKDAKILQVLRKDEEAFNKPGRAWIEDGYKVYEFTVGDSTLPCFTTISGKLKRLGKFLKDEGCHG